MGKREAQEILSDRVSLPSIPEVLARLNGMIDDPKVGVQQLGQVIAQDPSITAKVLRISNSSYYGLKEPVLSAEHAATILGARSLRNIVLQATVFARYDHLAAVPDFDLEAVWRHAIFVAQISQVLAKESPKPLGLPPEEFYTCGLLHDIGKVVVLESLGPDYIAIIQEARRLQQPLHICEQRALGFTHVDVGAMLAARWQLPTAVSDAIQFHHGPRYEILAHPAVAVVAIADQIGYRVGSASADKVLAQLGSLALEILGVTPECFARVLEHCRSVENLIEV